MNIVFPHREPGRLLVLGLAIVSPLPDNSPSPKPIFSGSSPREGSEMFGLHVLLAASMAAFAGALSPLGVVLSFLGIHLLLSLGAGFLGLDAYVERVRLGMRFIGWFLVEIVKASLDVARVVLAQG